MPDPEAGSLLSFSEGKDVPLISTTLRDRLYHRQPVFSFEFFPPKTPAGEHALLETVRELAPMAPDFVSVTYGAGGGTREKTHRLVLEIRRRFHLQVMAHMTCVGHTQEEVRSLLQSYQEGGITDILALRGDPPRPDQSWSLVEGGPSHAIDLVRMAKGMGGFSIGVAGFPEKHPEAPTLETDLGYLREKVDAGADFVVTQLFFDNDPFFDYVRRARRMGITVPVIPGIMPITAIAQIGRFQALSGCFIPQGLIDELRRHEGDPARVEAVGLAYCAAQCADLLRRGAPGIHFYTLNQSRACQTVFHALQALGFRNG